MKGEEKNVLTLNITRETIKDNKICNKKQINRTISIIHHLYFDNRNLILLC